MCSRARQGERQVIAPLQRWMAHSGVHLWVAALLGLALAFMLWDATGLDLAVSSLLGDAKGFALRSNWFLERVMHDGMRWLAWAMLGILAWCALLGKDRELRKDARWAVAGILIAIMSVQLIKRSSGTSCPWDLQMFGGWASYVSHWNFSLHDYGAGRCFPAGHASVAFGFLPAWAALRHRMLKPHWILTGIVCAGLLLGWVQVMRGAHFISHVLWSGWVCVVVAGMADVVRIRRARGIG